MIQRLNAQQTRQFILDLFPRGVCDLRIPEALDQNVVAETCALLAGTDVGISLGWFGDEKLDTRGILVGFLARDPLTGLKHGMEHIWWVDPAHRGRESFRLMEAFEEACKQAGCTRVTFGASCYVNYEKMLKMYRRRGYREFQVSMSKQL